MIRYLTVVFLCLLIMGGYVIHQRFSNDLSLPPVATIDMQVKTLEIKGVPIWYVPNEGTDLVCFSISFKGAGSAQDRIPGLTKLFTAMLNEGTSEMHSEAFQNFLLDNQIQLLPSFTSDHFSITIRTIASQIGSAFEVVKQIPKDLRFDQEDFGRNKDSILVSLEQAKHDPFAFSSDNLKRLAYKKHPYFLTIEDQINGMSELTTEHLKEVLLRFGQDNVQITAAGNITASQLEDLVNILIDTLPKMAEVKSIPEAEFNTEKTLHYVNMPVPQSIIRFVMPAIDKKDPDYYAYELLTSILGGTAMKSRMYLDIREKRGLAYYAQTNIVDNEKLNALMGITGTSTENEKQVIQLIKDNIQILQKEGVTTEELAFEKQHSSGTFALSFDSLLGTVLTLSSIQLDDFPTSYINDYSKHLESVTLDQIKKVASKYLDVDKLIIVVTGQNHAVSV